MAFAHSIHNDKARAKAARLGGFAGDKSATELYGLSKRELIEVAMRFGALMRDCPDMPDVGAREVMKEYRILKGQRLV